MSKVLPATPLKSGMQFWSVCRLVGARHDLAKEMPWLVHDISIIAPATVLIYLETRSGVHFSG